ncbi:MAG: hypothetical protein ACLGH7_12170, partial [Actinomycetes bacterium]
MKAPLQDPGSRMRLFHIGLLALAALVVLSLGFALVPAEKPAPAEPSFSERARAAAFTEAMELRSAGMELAAAGAADPAALDAVVTLLTVQARALQPPGAQASPSQPPASAAPASSASPASPQSAPSPPSPGTPRTAAELARALATSGTTRVADAETADGGMARLLAGTGTAQLLSARSLAAATGAPVPQAAAAPAADLPATVPT